MPVRSCAPSLLKLLRGRRVGLVCTPAAWDPAVGSLADWLPTQADVRAALALEHGFRGELQDGVHVAEYKDARTGLPVFSFYGAEKTVPPAFYADIDVAVFCTQDVSHRAYTFHWALAELLRTAAAAGRAVVVLDRPSPLLHLGAQGPSAAQFFPLPFPVLPGLTLGELVRWLCAAQRLDVDLQVIPAAGWTRDALWDETDLPWIPPSPNIPTVDSAYAYACTGLLQATNVAEGRGTCKPFEYFGAPFVDPERLVRALNAAGLPGVVFREIFFQPGFNKYAGQVCPGVHLLLTDRRALRPIETMFVILRELARLHPADFALTPGFAAWLDGGPWTVARLAELDIPATLAESAAAAAAFAATTAAHHLYA